VCPSCDSRKVRTIRTQDDNDSQRTTDEVKRRCFSCGWEWSRSVLDDLEASEV
jgi:hypothetical protein